MNIYLYIIQKERMEEEKVNSFTISQFERKLINAFRRTPNRLSMWLQYAAGHNNSMMPHHKELLNIYGELMHIMNQLHISYWWEYGSLLGQIRHQSMIPHDWDGDIGIMHDDLAKLLEHAKTYNQESTRFKLDYYSDPDYINSGYAIIDKTNPEILIDITSYRLIDGKLHCDIPEWNYPPYDMEDIFPLSRVMFMGIPSWLPSKPYTILKLVAPILGQCTSTGQTTRNEVSAMEYDPVPFILSSLTEGPRARLMYETPPFRNIPTFDLSKEKVDPSPTPYIYGQSVSPNTKPIIVCKKEFAFSDSPLGDMLYEKEFFRWGNLWQAIILEGNKVYIPDGWVQI